MKEEECILSSDHPLMCRCIKDIGTFRTNFNFFSKRIELSLSFHFFSNSN